MPMLPHKVYQAIKNLVAEIVNKVDCARLHCPLQKWRKRFHPALNKKILFRNSKGVALLQTLFMVMLIIFIVNEVNFEAAVEYTVNSQSLHRIKAYQAAKAGVEISLLRISIYNKVMKEFGSQLGSQAQMLNMIYSFPLTWPMIIPGASNSSIDKDKTKELAKKALMDATFATQIQTEERLNINDLDSPSETQRERIRSMLTQLFKSKFELDRDWVERNKGMLPYEDIINNIKDWIDPDTQTANGADESNFYAALREMDKDNQDRFPPNRHFRNMSEVRMVYGVTDAIYDLISPTFSTFGSMGINPNQADQGAIKSLHKTITDEIAGRLVSRRQSQNEGGPYKDADDFFNYAARQGARITPDEQKEIPISFSNPCNFKIQSTGSSGKTVVTVTAITYDVSCSQTEVSTAMKEANKDANNPTQTTTPGDNKPKGGSSSKQDLPKGPPRIVYWNET